MDPVRDAYDRLADQYDRRWARYIEATLRIAADRVALSSEERVLDVACGTGELERRLLSRWRQLRMVGLDLSGKMLRQAQSKRLGGEVGWVQGDVVQLPFADASFDQVICINSFHYFRAAEESLEEIRRVLRPGGTFVLVDWCDDYLSCKLCSLWLRWTDPAFYRTYSLKSCRAILQRAGFQVREAERFRLMWIWGLMRLVCRPAAAT